VSSLIAWATDWGVSLASLGGGILTIFVFQRGLPHVAWIVGYLLLLCLLFAFLVEMRRPLEESGRKSGRLILTAATYTIQTLYHAILLFLIPAYWASTTLTSINVVFLAVLVAMALLATFDPWYRALVHPRPWLGYVIFVVSVFAALNVALPLIGLPPYGALIAALFLYASLNLHFVQATPANNPATDLDLSPEQSLSTEPPNRSSTSASRCSVAATRTSKSRLSIASIQPSSPSLIGSLPLSASIFAIATAISTWYAVTTAESATPPRRRISVTRAAIRSLSLTFR